MVSTTFVAGESGLSTLPKGAVSVPTGSHPTSWLPLEANSREVGISPLSKVPLSLVERERAGCISQEFPDIYLAPCCTRSWAMLGTHRGLEPVPAQDTQGHVGPGLLKQPQVDCCAPRAPPWNEAVGLIPEMTDTTNLPSPSLEK